MNRRALEPYVRLALLVSCAPTSSNQAPEIEHTLRITIQSHEHSRRTAENEQCPAHPDRDTKASFPRYPTARGRADDECGSA